MTDHNPQDPAPAARLPLREWPAALLYGGCSLIAIPFTPIDGARFELGDVALSINASCILTPADVYHALWRHSRGEWGLVGEHEKRCNEEALSAGDTVASIHEAGRYRFWILTEPDRTTTTVMLPFDY